VTRGAARQGDAKVGAATYRPRSITGRGRRSATDLADLLQVVRGILDQQSGPISIRHLFYLTVSAGAVEKTERGYQNFKVEIWAEKDAIASILLEAADPWRVQVFPFRGFASLTSLYNAAETFREKQDEGKAVFVYYFGDHDPSGVAIDPAAVAALRDDFGVKIDFERVAVTLEQIAAHRLPTRPTKATDSRAKGFVGGSVEIDAMPRDLLIELVESCITQHLPADALARLRATEREQRASLQTLLASWTRRRKGRSA
jgi:hypothetical protein